MGISSDTRPLLSLEEVPEKPGEPVPGVPSPALGGVGPADPGALPSREPLSATGTPTEAPATPAVPAVLRGGRNSEGPAQRTGLTSLSFPAEAPPGALSPEAGPGTAGVGPRAKGGDKAPASLKHRYRRASTQAQATRV